MHSKGKNKTLFTVYALIMMCGVAWASVNKFSQDIRLPSQQVLEKQTVTDADLAVPSALVSAHAGVSGALVTITSFLTQPDVPRNIVVVAGGTSADIGTCTITATGKNIHNSTITETFAITANTAATQTGAKAFKSVSSVAIPAACEDSPYGATFSVGTGAKLGLNKCLDSADHFAWAGLDGAYEGTRPTVVADADEVEKNVATLSTALDGAKDANLFYIQNFRCRP